ncbi:MAG TPA: hypothetical protein VH277_17625 [Gemmatimonadaceae bacterium]|nr:hypothetical protein [Gemmatimonadaceae bacterium]
MRMSRLVPRVVWLAGAIAFGVLVALGLRSDDDGIIPQGAPSMPPAAAEPSPASPDTIRHDGAALGCSNPQPTWIWCDDFEQDRTSRYYEYVSYKGSLARQRGAGRNGSTSMRARWTAGDDDAGSLKVIFGRNPITTKRLADDGQTDYRELYWRVFVRSQPGWRTNGNDKFTRAIVFAGPKWEEAAIGHVWGGGAGDAQNHYVIDPASGVDAQGALATTKYNDFDHLRWLGATQGKAPVLGAGAGQWYCVEAHMRLNDPGQSNGSFDLWIDDVVDAQRAGLDWIGGYSSYGINALFLESYINKGAPQAQVRDYDDLVVSTTRIGCGMTHNG